MSFSGRRDLVRVRAGGAIRLGCVFDSSPLPVAVAGHDGRAHGMDDSGGAGSAIPRITPSAASAGAPAGRGKPRQRAISSSDRSLPPLHLSKIETCLPSQGPSFRLRFPCGRLGLTGGGTGFSGNRLVRDGSDEESSGR
jgi:hypothetical protein